MPLSAILLPALGVAAVSLAQPPAHEYLPPPAGPTWANRGALPAHLEIGAAQLSRPIATLAPQTGEHPQKGSTQRSVGFDRTTTHDGQLGYTATFNPSVVPLKRVTAFSQIDSQYRLRIGRADLQRLALAQRPPPPDRDVFWGSALLDLTANVPAALPSVAAEAAIISYQAHPATAITFYTDSADNHWIKAKRGGRLRLIWVTDAPRSYFSSRIPPLVTTEQVPRALRPRVPQSVVAAARRVHEHLGLRPSQPLWRQLDRLVAYFRSFRAEPLRRVSGDTYLDIALGQRGVCRHRSLAFVITAQALGVPARYVTNEAHAFVEIYAARVGWIRIDLGGAASALQVASGNGKLLHDAGQDPFPRPSNFRGGYSQLNQQVRGITRERLRRIPRSSGGYAGGGAGNRSTRGSTPAPSEVRQPSPAARRAAGSATSPDTTTSPSTSRHGSSYQRDETAAAHVGPDPTATESEDSTAKRATKLSVSFRERSVPRGTRVRVSGRISSGGKGLSGLAVRLFLQRLAQPPRPVGTTVSGERGRYRADLLIPLVIPPGTYRVIAETPGNERYAPATSR